MSSSKACCRRNHRKSRASRSTGWRSTATRRGDYFDYLRPVLLGEGRYALVIGDVTGHGIPAALIMTSARALLLSHAARSGSAGELLGVINESIARDAAQGRFITLAYLELDTNSKIIRAANAGHDPGLVYHAGTGVFDELPLGGLPLGIERASDTRASRFPGPIRATSWCSARTASGRAGTRRASCTARPASAN